AQVATMAAHNDQTIGELVAGQSTNATFNLRQSKQLAAFVQEQGNGFQHAVQSRRQAFGSTESGRLADLPNHSMAASFCGLIGQQGQGYGNNFVAPEGFDLTPLTERGDAIVLAWDAGNSPAPALNKFSPRRQSRDTLLRLAVPIKN
ncbi:MAG: hypothetical protein HY300_02450, partial [Verrucomicrobia bacterium]|nr:hypothetical protein [Verrucomicrobiota bacterium]